MVKLMNYNIEIGIQLRDKNKNNTKIINYKMIKGPQLCTKC